LTAGIVSTSDIVQFGNSSVGQEKPGAEQKAMANTKTPESFFITRIRLKC